MGVIFGVLEEEGQRLKEVIELYGEKIKKLPRGSLWFKKQNKKKYAYLAYRREGKMKFEYIGPAPSQKVEKISDKIKKRKEYEKSIKSMKKDLAVIEKSLKYARRK